MTDRRHVNLGESFAVPLTARVTRWLNRALLILFLNPLSQIVWGLLGSIVIALIVTRRLRDDHSLLLDIALVVLFFVIVEALGVALRRVLLRDNARVLAGTPVFGDLGGPGRRLFELILRLHPEQRIELSDEDDAVVRSLSDLDRRAVEETLRTKYQEIHAPAPVSEDDWAEVWSKLEARKAGSTTYGESLSGYTWQFLPFRVAAAQTFGFSLIGLYQIFAFWQLATLVDVGSGQLLPVMRAAVIATLAIALIIFLNHVYNSAEIELHPEPHTSATLSVLPDSVRGDFAKHVEHHQGHVIRPLKIDVTSRYHSLTRWFAVRLLTVVALGNALMFVVLLASTLPLTPLLVDDPSSGVGWTVRMMLGVLVIPLVLAAGTYFWLFVMQYRSRFVILAATAGGLTFLPPALTYLFGGDTSLSGTAALVNGIIAVVVTAIVDLVKEYAARPAAGTPSPSQAATA